MPNDLLRAQRAVFEAALDAQEKLVLLALLDHWSRTEPHPYPSIDRLAHRTALSRRTVLRAVKSLAGKGAIRVMHVGRHSAYDLAAIFRRELPSIGATQSPIDTADRCHTGTGATETPVPDLHAIGATQALGSVPGRHPKGSTEGTKEGTKRERARPGKSKRWTRFPTDYVPTEQDRAVAAREGVDFEYEYARIKNHTFRTPKVDASATLQNWMTSQYAKRLSGPAKRSAPVSTNHDTSIDDFPEVVA